MRISNLNYNDNAGAYEACVDIVAGGDTYSYPCTMSGPISMNMKRVRTGLARQARRMSVRSLGSQHIH